jgi:uncharacterized protein YcnI
VRKFTSILMVAFGVVASVLVGSTAAWAHDIVAPATVVAGKKVTVTVGVVNEHQLPSDGVEMRLPPGFVFAKAEEVPGWRTDVQRRSDGTPSAVRWTGGLIERNALAEFVVSGTTPSSAGSLVWAVAQKSVGGKAYVAPPVAATPHMTVTAKPLGGAGAASAPPVPLAAAPQTAASTTDGVARSRATLALVLAGLALLGVIAFGSAMVRRTQQPLMVEQDSEPAAADVTPKSAKSAKTSGKRDRPKAMSTSAGSRR